MKIAGAQLGSIWEDPLRSLEKAESILRQAADQGAGLVCFPEQYPTGWDPVSQESLQDRDGFIVARFRALATEYGIAIMGSFRERAVPGPRNTCIVFDKDGEEIASYSKRHLFSPVKEDEGYIPGDGLGIFRIAGIPFGIAICYDLRFTELFRIYAEAGVSCMIVPAAWPASRIEQWELFLRARALEYQFYVAGVNTVGQTPVDCYCGGSLVSDPSGTVVAHAGAHEELLIAEIDPLAVARARAAIPVIRDGRHDRVTPLTTGQDRS